MQPADKGSTAIKKRLTLVAAGIVAGLLASAGLTRFIASQLFRVSSRAWTFGAVVAPIVAVAVEARWVPARAGQRKSIRRSHFRSHYGTSRIARRLG
jgi:hypothetical protein